MSNAAGNCKVCHEIINVNEIGVKKEHIALQYDGIIACKRHYGVAKWYTEETGEEVESDDAIVTDQI